MKEFWFIRHGESNTNAGLPSDSDQATGLTEKGHKQASFVPLAVKESPDLFVVSPYLRTRLTADPTLQKYPQVPVETWPIHEFTYLSHDQYAGTTNKERRNLSIGFFRQNDPDLVLGEGGESFNQFIQRVEKCLHRLSVTEYKRIVLFGHGWFTRASLWLLLEKASPDQRETYLRDVNHLLITSPLLLRLYRFAQARDRLRSFLLFSAGVQTPNCSILKYQLDKSGELKLSGFDVSHLPEEYSKTTLRNR